MSAESHAWIFYWYVHGPSLSSPSPAFGKRYSFHVSRNSHSSGTWLNNAVSWVITLYSLSGWHYGFEQTRCFRLHFVHTAVQPPIHTYILTHEVESNWNVMAHGDTREGRWRGNCRMEWVDSTLHTISERGVSSITTTDARTSAASSRRYWRPRRFKWTRPFCRKTKSGFCTCAITFELASTVFERKQAQASQVVYPGIPQSFQVKATISFQISSSPWNIIPSTLHKPRN